MGNDTQEKGFQRFFKSFRGEAPENLRKFAWFSQKVAKQREVPRDRTFSFKKISFEPIGPFRGGQAEGIESGLVPDRASDRGPGGSLVLWETEIFPDVVRASGGFECFDKGVDQGGFSDSCLSFEPNRSSFPLATFPPALSET
jgi:hypothetical protein